MPAISRPLLIVLILAVVAAVAFYATQGGRESTDVAAPVVPPREPAPAMSPPPPAPPAQERSVGPRADATEAGGQAPAEGPAGKAGKAGPTAGVPPAMARAIGQGKPVVLLLYRPGSADDRATSRSVAALRGRGGAVVFTDPIGRIGRYRGLVEDLGISQAPAVVIVGRDGAARVIEGYVDRATLAQDVADAR